MKRIIRYGIKQSRTFKAILSVALFLICSQLLHSQPIGATIDNSVSESPRSQHNYNYYSWYIPFQHCYTGLSMGYSKINMAIKGASDDTRSGDVNRIFSTLRIMPLPFLRIKAIYCNPVFSEMEAHNDPTRLDITISRSTYLREYGMDASLILPLFWHNGVASLYSMQKGLFASIGGTREWSTIHDTYDKFDNSSSPATNPLEEITGQLKRKKWNVSAGLFYRFLFRQPFAGAVETGVEYCPLFKQSFIAYGTKAVSQTVERVAISHAVEVRQEIPARIFAAVDFKVY
jgi:hypothetical protein